MVLEVVIEELYVKWREFLVNHAVAEPLVSQPPEFLQLRA